MIILVLARYKLVDNYVNDQQNSPEWLEIM